LRVVERAPFIIVLEFVDEEFKVHPRSALSSPTVTPPPSNIYGYRFLFDSTSEPYASTIIDPGVKLNRSNPKTSSSQEEAGNGLALASSHR
ncbi:unnamed protein product, partial [Ilex paraguariensis]